MLRISRFLVDSSCRQSFRWCRWDDEAPVRTPGIEYKHGSNDCYGLIRRFYKDNFDLNLRNYARPHDWWNTDLSLYQLNYHKEGFRPLDAHPSDWRPADLFLMAVKSTKINHSAILLENGKILHHVPGRFSGVETYSGMWRNLTCGILRHKDIHFDMTPGTIDARSLL